MCVTFCHRRRLLYWNHDPCTTDMCPVAGEAPRPCQTCRHRRDDDTCALTNASLPEAGGCCHWNVTLTGGLIPVTPGMVALLAGFFETAKEVLADLPHRMVGDEWVIPADHAPALEALGITYRTGAEGLHLDAEQLVLMVEEPVADILNRLDAPYSTGSDLVWVDPDDLALPVTAYGVGTEF